MTHLLQEYKSLLTSSLNASTLASIALPLLALSVVSQTSTVDNAQ